MPFPETRPSVVAAVASAEPEVRSRALEALAAAYWRPVFVYLRARHGRSSEEASDLTQELFARLVERRWLDGFDARKGRLRTYLRVLADGLAANEARAAGATKRGGEAVHEELDAETLAARERPDEAFEREWVRSVFALALARFRASADSPARRSAVELFTAVELESAEPRPSYAELARRFGISTSDVTNRLAAGRRDFRRAVLDVLRELTGSDAELRLEARALLGVELP
jgi:RNA polymerase sigma factor (sigma-70 family)